MPSSAFGFGRSPDGMDETGAVALGHREVVRAHVLHAEPEELRRRLGRGRDLDLDAPSLLVRGELFRALHLGYPMPLSVSEV